MIFLLIGLVVIVVLLAIFAYNRLVTLRQAWKRAFADIDVQLKQRQDLVPNLVETVKGYAAHESTVFTAGDAGARHGDARDRRGGEERGRGRAVGRAGQPDGGGGELSRAQGQPELPQAAGRAGRSREQDRRRAPVPEQRGGGIQFGHPAIPGGADRGAVRLRAGADVRARPRTSARRPRTRPK